jgi:hypothetical protein
MKRLFSLLTVIGLGVALLTVPPGCGSEQASEITDRPGDVQDPGHEEGAADQMDASPVVDE